MRLLHSSCDSFPASEVATALGALPALLAVAPPTLRPLCIYPAKPVDVDVDAAASFSVWEPSTTTLLPSVATLTLWPSKIAVEPSLIAMVDDASSRTIELPAWIAVKVCPLAVINACSAVPGGDVTPRATIEEPTRRLPPLERTLNTCPSKVAAAPGAIVAVDDPSATTTEPACWTAAKVCPPAVTSIEDLPGDATAVWPTPGEPAYVLPPTTSSVDPPLVCSAISCAEDPEPAVMVDPGVSA